jgi:hypothetical protein
MRHGVRVEAAKSFFTRAAHIINTHACEGGKRGVFCTTAEAVIKTQSAELINLLPVICALPFQKELKKLSK